MVQLGEQASVTVPLSSTLILLQPAPSTFEKRRVQTNHVQTAPAFFRNGHGGKPLLGLFSVVTWIFGSSFQIITEW